MTQALNFTPKAIEALRSHPLPDAPISRAAMRWIAAKLEQAQVFILPDCGQILDRDKPHPEVPGIMFRPSFPVVACEYLAQNSDRATDFYTQEKSSRRIALAWDWQNDLPPPLNSIANFDILGPGVAVMSVFYVDKTKMWVCNSGAIHLPYEGEWLDPATSAPSAFREAMIRSGQMKSAVAKAKALEGAYIPLMVEAIGMARSKLGSMDAVIDLARADANDELNAYIDLSFALACRNVIAERVKAPEILNRERRRKKRPELKDFHILKLAGEQAMFASGQPGGHRTGPRPHLRRGHIRRLDETRITWVNQTMVHGQGAFLDKAYAL